MCDQWKNAVIIFIDDIRTHVREYVNWNSIAAVFLIHFFIEHIRSISLDSKPVNVSIFGCSELLNMQPSFHKDPLPCCII